MERELIPAFVAAELGRRTTTSRGRKDGLPHVGCYKVLHFLQDVMEPETSG
jgi:hypothetical protein